MDFFDNVMKSSNALIKERLNNPFGGKQQAFKQDDQQQLQQQQTAHQAESNMNDDQQPETSSSSQTNYNNQTPSTTSDQTPFTGGGGDNGTDKFAAIAADAEAVRDKAVKGAKNLGSFLFSMANKAGQTVSQTAKQVKQVVESTSILTDFTREQQDFIKEHGGNMQSGELPWADCADETKAADIREQILSLSQDKRNFVRSPPNDGNFKFDPQQSYPVALSLLKEDPNLSKMRFELVPKMVNEDTFWCNYFYRVSLLKQLSERGEDIKQQKGWASSRSSSGEGPDEITSADDGNQNEEVSSDHHTSAQGQKPQSFNLDNLPVKSAQQEEYESSESRKLVAEADDLKSKLRELNIGSLDDGGGQDENDKWEEELQRDLQEFELVSGDVSALDEEALDKDILELKQQSAKNN